MKNNHITMARMKAAQKMAGKELSSNRPRHGTALPDSVAPVNCGGEITPTLERHNGGFREEPVGMKVSDGFTRDKSSKVVG